MTHKIGFGELNHGLSKKSSTKVRTKIDSNSKVFKLNMYCSTNASDKCEDMPEKADFINDGASLGVYIVLMPVLFELALQMNLQ